MARRPSPTSLYHLCVHIWSLKLPLLLSCHTPVGKSDAFKQIKSYSQFLSPVRCLGKYLTNVSCLKRSCNKAEMHVWKLFSEAEAWCNTGARDASDHENLLVQCSRPDLALGARIGSRVWGEVSDRKFTTRNDFCGPCMAKTRPQWWWLKTGHVYSSQAMLSWSSCELTGRQVQDYDSFSAAKPVVNTVLSKFLCREWIFSVDFHLSSESVSDKRPEITLNGSDFTSPRSPRLLNFASVHCTKERLDITEKCEVLAHQGEAEHNRERNRERERDR